MLDPPPESWLGPHMDKSPQAVFDKIVAHLRQQNARSISGVGDCMYRGEGGRMCAVGCLIPDDVYRPGLEGALDDIEFFNGWPDETYTLLGRMQIIHDQTKPEDWESEFRALAAVEMLTYTAPAAGVQS